MSFPAIAHNLLLPIRTFLPVPSFAPLGSSDITFPGSRQHVGPPADIKAVACLEKGGQETQDSRN